MLEVDFQIPDGFLTEDLEEGFRNAEVLKRGSRRGLPVGDYQSRITAVHAGIVARRDGSGDHRFVSIEFELVGSDDASLVGTPGEDHQGINTDTQLGILKSRAAGLGMNTGQSLGDMLLQMSSELPGTVWNMTVREKDGFTNIFWNSRIN